MNSRPKRSPGRPKARFSKPKRPALKGGPRPSHDGARELPVQRGRAAARSTTVDLRDRTPTHVASVEHLAETAVGLVTKVERAVFQEGKRADRALAALLRTRRELAAPDLHFLSQAVFALFRWHGWLEPEKSAPPEARLLLAWLLDAPSVHPVCRAWARVLGRDLSRLNTLGDAPNWTARAEGLKRWFDGRAINADPWRLFPAWFREHLPLPPGGATPKARYLELLLTLQTRPSLWVRAQGGDAKALWAELTEMGHKPWIHRHVSQAAKIDPEADVHHLPAFLRGELEIQDLASQAVALACDPDAGERWWDVCAGAGGKALHLASLMKGKGLVVATDVNAYRLKEAVRRARRSPFRNLTTKEWDGRHLPSKAKSFHGVLVDAPCSGIGTWRRNPDARWNFDSQAIGRLAEVQTQLLHTASLGVRPGGTLVYSVCTLTPSETTAVVRSFLETHPDFQLDPFPHPLNGTPTEGSVLIWPQEADTDAMFIARMVRTATPKANS